METRHGAILMRAPFELIVAVRYLRSRRKAGFTAISGITVGGVALGVCALIVVTSVWNGFEAEFLDKLLRFHAHANVARNYGPFKDYSAIASALEKTPGIEHAQPAIYQDVILQSGTGAQGVLLKGVAAATASTSPLARYIEPDVFRRLKRQGPRPSILIGRELATILGVSVGGPLTVLSPHGARGGTPKTRTFTVSGTFHSGMYEFDTRLAVVALDEADDYFNMHGAITWLEVWTDDPLRSQSVLAKAMQSISKDDPLAYSVTDWSETHRGTFGAMRTQKGVISIVLATIIAVAGFNIAATLILLILEKQREISLLKSLGASHRSILYIFLIDGQLVGAAGCLLGTLLGLGLCVLLERYGLRLDPRVYYLERLPVLTRASEVTAVVVLAMLTATCAGIVPALRAARLSPVAGLTQRTSAGRPAAPPQAASN